MTKPPLTKKKPAKSDAQIVNDALVYLESHNFQMRDMADLREIIYDKALFALAKAKGFLR